MNSSHLIRATGASSAYVKFLQTSSTKSGLHLEKTTGTKAGSAGRTAHRHMSTLQPPGHPVDTGIGGSKRFRRINFVNSQSLESSSCSITSSATSHNPATALATLPASQYIPRYDQTSLPRRQSLTAGENRKIEDMFSSIFNAASHQEELMGPQNGDEPAPWVTKPMRFSTKPIPIRWTRPGDDVLDQMKEEIEHCGSDQELYAWTLERLFAELDGSLSQVQFTSIPTSMKNDTSEALPKATQQASATLPAFAYPQLLAIVMRTFRTKYRDPHTALALFDHAQNASPTSYVTCCGTAAYNELIETKWDSFRDLQGVCDALEEMKLNKVRIDTRTTKLVEGLRREVGQRNFWQEEGFGESHTGVMDLLERIESTCWPAVDSSAPGAQIRNRLPPPNAKWRVDSEVWKRPTSNEHDGLEFV